MKTTDKTLLQDFQIEGVKHINQTSVNFLQKFWIIKKK